MVNADTQDKEVTMSCSGVIIKYSMCDSQPSLFIPIPQTLDIAYSTCTCTVFTQSDTTLDWLPLSNSCHTSTGANLNRPHSWTLAAANTWVGHAHKNKPHNSSANRQKQRKASKLSSNYNTSRLSEQLGSNETDPCSNKWICSYSIQTPIIVTFCPYQT